MTQERREDEDVVYEADVRPEDWKDPKPVSEDEQRDFYQRLRSRIREWLDSRAGRSHKAAELVLVAPDLFHLLWRLSLDPAVSPAAKTRFLVVLAYFISPFDLLPEALLGPAAFADDVVLAAFALHRFIEQAGDERVRHHWAGEEDILVLVRSIVAKADAILGSGLLKRLRRVLR